MYDAYLSSIRDNLKKGPKEWNFKSDPRYQIVLEHVNPNQGRAYMDCIKSEYGDLFEKHEDDIINICKRNDEYGVPSKISFDQFMECSPTNIRYIYHSLLAFSHMKKYNLNEVNIVEIGGGYGGLSFFIYSMSKFFDINIKSYKIFDLIEASKLQEKYSSLLGFNIETCNIEEEFEILDNSFVISNYAFSEIDESFRSKYQKSVIGGCAHGFMAWNHIPVYKFTDKEIHTEPERPHMVDNNYFVTF